jgi:hypothetical protein
MPKKAKPAGDEFDAAAMAANLLIVNTLLVLERKGILSNAELIEITDAALLNLEEHQGEQSPEYQARMTQARAALELFLKLISPSGSE